MKKYVLIKEKATIRNIIIVSILTMLCCLFFIYSMSTMLKNNLVFGLGYDLIALILIAIVFVFFMSKQVTFIYIDSISIKKGLIFPRKVYFYEIEKINFGETIHIQHENKNLIIKVLGLDKNKKEYEEIISIISKKSELNYNNEHAVNRLEEYKGTRPRSGTPKTKRLIILIVLGLFLVAIFTLMGVSLARFYSSANTNLYTSIEEIINSEFKGNADYIKYDDYYFIIYRKKEINGEQLIWEYEDNKLIYFNDFNVATKDSKQYVDVLLSDNFIGEVNAYSHKNKYIILIETWRDKANIVIEDNYGIWEYTLSNDTKYYFKVLEKEEVTEQYEIYAKSLELDFRIFSYKEMDLK